MRRWSGGSPDEARLEHTHTHESLIAQTHYSKISNFAIFANYQLSCFIMSTKRIIK